MRGKIAFILGGAIGYVLGSRAGRERYEQIKRGANHLWHTEPVQNGVSIVKDAVDERTDELKAFAIRVGGDIFTNLAQGKRTDPFKTTDDAAANEASSSSKAASSKPQASKAASSRSSAAKSKSGSGGSKSGGGKASS